MGSKDTERAFRTLMGRLATGVTVVACGDARMPIAMTANSVTSVSLEPPLLLVCVRNRSRWLPALMETRRFSVNVLHAAQRGVSQHFAGQPGEPGPLQWIDREGAPLLRDSAAAFSCEVEATHAAGDHTIVIGKVHAMQGAQHGEADDGEALVYVCGQYSSLPFPGSRALAPLGGVR